LLDVDRVLDRLLAYLLTTALALGAFYGLIALLTVLLQDAVQSHQPPGDCRVLLLLAAGLDDARPQFDPARHRPPFLSLAGRLSPRPDQSFAATGHHARPEQTLRTMEEQLQQALSPEKFVVYLYNDEMGKYFPHASREDSAVPYQVEDPLIHHMMKVGAPVWLPPSGELPERLRSAPGNYQRLKATSLYRCVTRAN